MNDATGISDNIERVLLLEKGKPFEVFRYRIAILNALFVKGEFQEEISGAVIASLLVSSSNLAIFIT